MTPIASGNRSWSLWERSTTKWPPSSHSNVVRPDTTSSTRRCFASVVQLPMSASKGARRGSRSVMSVGPYGRPRVIALASDGDGLPRAAPPRPARAARRLRVDPRPRTRRLGRAHPARRVRRRRLGAGRPARRRRAGDPPGPRRAPRRRGGRGRALPGGRGGERRRRAGARAARPERRPRGDLGRARRPPPPARRHAGRSGRRARRPRWGAAAPERAAPPAAAVAALVAAVVGQLPPADELDPLVRAAALRAAAPRAAVERVAEDVGLGERQLRRRFDDAVGYGPKTLQRVLRFQRFLALAGETAGAPDLAQLAFAAGYADQAHLTRECRRLSGLTPSALLATGAGPAGDRSVALAAPALLAA